MAHPLLVTEFAVKNFISQWYCGLTPSLQLTTDLDSSVRVTSRTSSYMISPQTFNCQRRRSGKASRRRRLMNRKDENSKKYTDNEDTIRLSNMSTSPITSTSSFSPDPPVVYVDAAVQATISTVDAMCEPFPKLCQSQNFPIKPNLSISKACSTSLPPRPIYHPAVINACKTMHGKHPSELSQKEAHTFKFYLQWKCDRGEPVETDVVHLPSGMRDCLHCGHLT